VLFAERPPKVRVNSGKLWTVVGTLTGPRVAYPTKPVTDVATPVIVRTPLGTSSM
jgi:hypothetical protein